MKLKWCVASLVFASGLTHAQEKIELDQYCNYAGSTFSEDVFGFSSDNEATRLLGRS